MVRDCCSVFVFLCMMGTASAQPQTIPIHGTVTGSDGFPVVDAEITLFFNNSNIAKTRSEKDGSYRFTGIFYGEIQEIDLEAGADYGYSKIKVKNIAIDSLPLDITLKKASGNGVVIYAFREPIERTYCPTNDYYPDGFWDSYTYHNPWLSYYSKPMLPVYYYPKITQKITVLDNENRPVPNARVQIKVPDDSPRWGFTDENGKLTLYMQFARGARFANISVLADGYKPFKRRHRELDVHTQNVYQLSKMDF